MAFNNIKDGEFTKTIYTMVHEIKSFPIVPFTKSSTLLPIQIKEERFTDAITMLISVVDANPTVHNPLNMISHEMCPLLSFTLQSKAGLSLLGYCCYQVQDFLNAASCYEQLVTMHGAEQEEYKLYWAQALYQAGLYSNALKACSQIPAESKLKGKALKLESAVRFAEEDLVAAQAAVSAAFARSSANDVDTLVNMGCILYKVSEI